MPAPDAPARRQEIAPRSIKLIVGVIALSLAGLTDALAPAPLDSISAAYHAGGWPQAFIIGFLFAIAAFLLAYNGVTTTEMVLIKGFSQAKMRAGVCAACGVVILVAIVTPAVDGFSGGVLSARVSRFTFYGEATALVAFGVSWLTASRVIPLMTREDERFSPFRAENPE